MKLASAFCHSASSLCTFCLIWCCLLASMSKNQFKAKQLEGKSETHYRRCVPPCKHYMSAGDTHSLCVVCLGTRHAESESEDVFLLAISSLKRVGDLQALSVAPTHLDCCARHGQSLFVPSRRVYPQSSSCHATACHTTGI